MIRQLNNRNMNLHINMKIHYERIFNPLLMDVSLRDGIQDANVKDYPTNIKKKIIDNIIYYYKPSKIEVGSLVNPKILPIMEDSIELYNYTRPKSNDVFMLIPSFNKFEEAIKHNITNLSFITSVSDEFQKKNTNKSIDETKEEFKIIFKKLLREHFYEKYYTKLYISCIQECPIKGLIDDDKIINEIFYYHINYRFNELCLSDTMGTLDPIYFEYILERSIYIGIPSSKFSVHFHYSPSNIINIERLLRICFKYNIKKYDVSMIDTGGCSVTMDSSKLNSNLSYDLFYHVYNRYILDSS
jgi:hydroxymethylglutaryl-CoA lyase